MNDRQIQVRPATTVEEEAASRLAERVYAPLRQIYQPTAMARLNADSFKPKLQRLVALDNDRIVGTVKYHVDDGKLRVIGLAVDVECRNRGVAKKLIEELTHQAKYQGAQTLNAYTVRDAGAVPFYERLGFRIVKEVDEGFFESPEGKPMPEVLMERSV